MDGNGVSGKGIGGMVAFAALGGLLLAVGLLLIVFLGSSLMDPLSVPGMPGTALFKAFSWAAWFLPLWALAAAALAVLAGNPLRTKPVTMILLGFAALPFLCIAAFARLLDSSSPMAPGLTATPRFALAALFGLLGVGSAAAIAWFLPDSEREEVAGSRMEPDDDFDQVVRPGFFTEEAKAASDETGESQTPIIAGRHIVQEDIAAETPPDIPTAASQSSRGNPVPADIGHFRVPIIPPLPPLRSLGQTSQPKEPASASPEAPETAEDVADVDAAEPFESIPGIASIAHTEIEDLPEHEELPKVEDLPKVAAQALVGAARNAPTVTEAETPIPLFFRGAAPVSGAPIAEAGTAETILELGQRTIEVISVLPATPAHEAAEPEKANIIARILDRKKRPPYVVPVAEILHKYPDGEYWVVDEKTRLSAEVLRETLAEFNIEAEVTGIRKGPVITMFEILPAPGVRLSKIANLCDNIALRLAASSVRIVAPIPGKHAVGIEVPNERRSIVSLREIVESESFVGARAEVPVALGKDIAGEVQFIDLTQTPHLLIAGSTGSGKSVCVNAIILSILFRRSPEEVRLLLIDPKIVELKLYNGVPHLLTPVITEPKRAFQALQYCICEMERRYAMLDRVGVRDIKSYNRKIKEKSLAQDRLPYIVVIIDEFADLMATTGKELESTLARLAAMSRAVGIHLVLATQRPSIDVITGLIKANIPSRVAFMVASKFDSRIIIDMVGAEKLLGKGDMLFASAWDPFPIRMQGAFVSEEEVEKAVEYIKTLGEPQYIDEDIFIDDEEDESEPSLFDDGDGDPLFEQALEIVLQQGRASASYIQRKLKIGYNRAARIVELMEEKGIVGKAQGSKPRDLVRNPSITGLGGAGAGTGDSAGMSKMAMRELETDGSQRRPSLVGTLETVPGQRVTGKDEE
ncbi:MAG: DNA translocase FtsK [Spirochaetota bacterium]